jgi:DNA-binding response OmpR family regulator
MVSVLIVDDDAQLRRALLRTLSAHGFESKAASNYEEAIDQLGKQPYDVLLTDLRMGEKDGIDLLNALQELAASPRAILMSAYATARDSQRALDLGAIRVLCKPFETREVIDAIERAVEASYVGSVHGLSLIDMLQMFHYSRRSVVLELLGKDHATISLQEGEIVDARVGNQEGEVALRLVLTRPAGSLKTRSLGEVTRTIARPFQPLLLDLLRELDEHARQRNKSNGPAASTSTSPGRPSASPGGAPGRALVESTCQELVARVNGAFACELIDLDSGLSLGAHSLAGTAERSGYVPIRTLVQLFRGEREATPDDPVEELQLSRKEHLLLVKLLPNGRAALQLAARRGANVALAWMQLRSGATSMSALFPERTDVGLASQGTALHRDGDSTV